MSFRTQFSTGRIDKGDTKTFYAIARDEDGQIIVPAVLTLHIYRPSGAARDEHLIGTWSQLSEERTVAGVVLPVGAYYVRYTHTESGRYKAVITCRDSSGNQEVETHTYEVHA